MANQKHLTILNRGAKKWNQWRKEHAYITPDLRDANLNYYYFSCTNLSGATLWGAGLREAYLREVNLSGATLWEADLSKANLREANLSKAKLREANLSKANLSKADLREANLEGADLRGADLSEANLEGADLRGADLRGADLSKANLRGATLSEAVLIETNLTGATLTQCAIYGISVWKVQLEGAKQDNLVITDRDEPVITIDNLEVAQFIYLLLNNPKIREVIDTVAKKAVLILGRFTPERKAVLDALREALRTHGYVPILFDFGKPSSQDLTETVSILAHLSRFILVDLTDPSSVPYEVGMIASNHIRPIQALFHPSDGIERVFGMFPDLIRRYHWVLPPYEYQDLEHLLASLQTKVIDPAEQKAQELEKR
jgi:uncharacterized protein YjbI with pentapeptide repeats